MKGIGLAVGCLFVFALRLMPAGTAQAGPDRIVSACSAPGVPQDTCVIDPDSGDPVNLTNTNTSNESQPAFSPDGS